MTTVFGPSSADNTPVGMINRLYNGDFSFCPNGTEVVADGATVFVNWYVLTQSGTITASQLSYPEDGQYACARFTQSSATAQRYGFAQRIQPGDCGDLRTALMNAGARLRFSDDASVRWAILASTAGTLDVVNDWTSNSYVPGSFFISGVEVVNQGIFRDAEDTWGPLPQIPYQGPDNFTYLQFFVWTQDEVAQGGYLDGGLCQVAAGVVTQPYEHRPYDLASAIEFIPSQAWGNVIVQNTIGEGQALIDEGQPFTDIASATTTTLSGVDSNKVRITGTTTITSFGSADAGIYKTIRFAGALTLTHNGTSLILPGAANITTAANDCCIAVSLGSGNWIVTGYQPATQAGMRSLAGSLSSGAVEIYGTPALDRPVVQVIRDNVMPSLIDFGGVGDGTTDDSAALTSALSQNRGVYLPFARTNGNEATWYFASPITVGASKVIRGDPRKSAVKQGAAQLFVIDDNNIVIENLLIDQSNQASTAQATFNFNTSSGGCQNIRIANIFAGIARNLSTLQAGYRFMDDDAGAGSVVDIIVDDVVVYGAKAAPFYLRDFLAACIFKSVVVDFTRQAAAPTYAGFDVDGGAGLHFELCNIQGVGTGGSGNAAGHGYLIQNASAVDFTNCRGDTVGGYGFRFVNVVGAVMTSCVAPLSGEGQAYYENVTSLQVNTLYAQGRNATGSGWIPAGKHNITVTGCTRPQLTGVISVEASGSGAYWNDTSAGVVTGFDLRANTTYGIELAGTSNFNLVGQGTFASNGTNNGLFVNANNARSGLILNSGAFVAGDTPGAGAF